MPSAEAKAFVHRIRVDNDLQVKLKAIEAESRDAMLKEIAKIASEAGYPLTPDAAAAIVKEEGEITEDQLEQVAGGLTSIPVASVSGIATIPTASTSTTATSQEGGIVPAHAYTVIGTCEVDGEEYVCLRNPWGTAG